jgi:hypothetical protein
MVRGSNLGSFLPSAKSKISLAIPACFRRPPAPAEQALEK